MVYPALLSLMRTPQLPVVDWTDAPVELNGLVCFAERRNLVSARVISHLKRSLLCSDDPHPPPHYVLGAVCGDVVTARSKGRFTHSMPCPCRAAKGLECVFPIWFTQCGRVWCTPAMPRPCHALTCRSSQGHGTARPSRDGLWATYPRSASSGYHAEFYEDCYQKHTNPAHKDPYLRL